MRMTQAAVVASAIAGTALCGGARAQSAAPAAGADAIPEKVAPGTAVPNTDVSKQGGTLSDKLSTSNGVIHPATDVDPGISKQAPATGTMPVIPPPGSPGGASNVQPK